MTSTIYPEGVRANRVLLYGAVQTVRNASRDGSISKNVTERDRGGRGFALALRKAGMSAYEQVDLLTLYRDETRKYYKIEIYFVFYPIIIIN